MRHRRRGRKLGRNPKHQRALLRSLATNLILTERDPDDPLFDPDDPLAPSAPKVRGRIVTTVAKAKEVRPFVERCITIAKKAQAPLEAAAKMEPDDERGSSAWKSWRQSDRYGEWNQTIAPALAAQRRLIQLLGDKEAVKLLLDEIAPRFMDREGGYTRIVQLAHPRLGDAGPQAIIEFVGKNDRSVQKSQRPTFDAGEEDDDTSEEAIDESTEEAVEDPTETSEEGGADSEETAAGDDDEKAEK